MFNKSRHIIREQDLEPDNFINSTSNTTEIDQKNDKNQNNNENITQNNAGDRLNAASDVYNSDYKLKKTTIFNKDFFKFFKLPIIIIIFLIAAILSLKLIFSRIGATKNNNVSSKNYKGRVITEKKQFSPAIFNTKTGLKKNVGQKFNNKFNKEIKGLNKIKLSKTLKKNYNNGKTGMNPKTETVSKGMVVFVEPSYNRKILSMEKTAGDGTDKQQKKYKNTDYARSLSGKNMIRNAHGKLIIPQGTVMNAYTKYKIFSYNTEVPIIAELTNNYKRNGKTVLERGCKFFGMVSVKHSLDRLNINFNKIIKINGHSLTIDAIAMMPNGSGGIKGKVHNHYTGSILASIAQGVVGAASIFVGGGSGINSSNPYTFQNQLRENVAQNELGNAQSGINSYASSKNNVSITLKKDAHIKIIFLKAVYK